ncbi:MAG: hypothetical protein LBO09_09435 [Candidatus Peribacteria bacterium]|jgi:hypothetical protein|nr:hypothetical protein [Candidatus Peribacteria bacterium]
MTGTAGTTVNITTMPGYATFSNIDDPMRYAQFQSSASTVIAGTNSTIINVYCRLKVYTITFDLGSNTSRLTIPKTGGTTYTRYYSINVKFGQDVTDTWPSSATATFSNILGGSMTYGGWLKTSGINGYSGNTTTYSRVNYIISDFMPTNADILNLTLTKGSSSAGSMHVRYYAEQLPGQIGGITRTYN